MEPVAYIRRSARSRDAGDLSREFQIEKVRDLANGDGATLRIIDEDWGRSAATDKTDKRLAFLALLEAVERGEVSTLYAYACDRLARSVEWSARLLNACRRAGTVIVTSEGRFEPDNGLTNQLFYFQAMQNEGYSQQATEKRRATVSRQRARGDKLGPAFYGALPGEDLPAVLAAFDATGSAHGAAIRLNRAKVPTRRGRPWTHGSVRQILVREGRMPRLGTRGAKTRAPFALYRLLRCHCGQILTGVVQRYGKDNAKGRTIYRCVNASADPDHGPKTISAARVMPWIMAEAARFRVPGDAVQLAENSEAARAAITEERRRLAIGFARGGLDEGTFEAEDQALVDRLANLEDQGNLTLIPAAIDWDGWAPADVNAVLRSYWRGVNLDPNMQPIDADWKIPAEFLA